MNTLPRALIFDFGGVISKTLFETHEHSEAALGLPKGSLTWRGPFDIASDSLWQQMQRDELSERQYWLTRTKEVGAMLGEEWSTMQTLVQRSRGDNPDLAIRPQTVKVIEAAAHAGIPLAILSNELDMFYGKALRKKVSCLKYFGTIVDATYTGILKPDPRAYQLCCAEINFSPSDCLFIDDQLRNVYGAQSVGMQTVHFDVLDPDKSCNEIRQLAGLQ